MLNKILWCTTLIVLWGLNLKAQHNCGTTPAEQTTTYDFVQQQRTGIPFASRTVVDEVPIQIHIIGGANGVFAIDSSIVLEELEIVNEAFADINIKLVQCRSINFIYSNSYLTFIKGTDEILCDIHDVTGVINIYFPPKVERQDGETICGYAYNFDIEKRVFVSKDCADNGSTFTHEMGHSFSLVHTHTTVNGPELADGSNCSNAGDLLCDTPADPRLNGDNVDNNCIYIGTEVDEHQNPYYPDPSNIMSYAPKVCRTMFSLEQLTQMESYYVVEGGILSCAGAPTSVGNIGDQVLVKVFPNPSQQSFFVEGLTGNAQLDIFNIDGKLLFSQDIENITGKVEVSNPAIQNPGVYYLKTTSDNHTSLQKIIRL